MAAEKRAIRRRAVFLAKAEGRSRGLSTRDGSTALTATGGTTATLIDTSGMPAGITPTYAKNTWLWLPAAVAAGDRKRVISGYTPAAFTFALNDPVLALAPAAGVPYLLVKDDPDLWDSALAEACRTMLASIHYDEVTPTGLVRYAIVSAPFSLASITTVGQVLDVEVRSDGDEAGYEHWLPWADGVRTWRAYSDENGIIIDFGDELTAPSTGDILRVKWTGLYTPPATESTSLAVDELLAAQATVVQMADWLANVDDPSDDWNIIGRRVRAQYAERRRLILGADAYRRVQRPAERTGILRMRGRGGR